MIDKASLLTSTFRKLGLYSIQRTFKQITIQALHKHFRGGDDMKPCLVCLSRGEQNLGKHAHVIFERSLLLLGSTLLILFYHEGK